MLLDELNVSNYRGINSFTLDNLKPITIFVGKNNSGKSSLLESISLLCSSSNGWYDVLGDDILNSIFQKRGGEEYENTMINYNNETCEISGRGKFGNGKLIIQNELRTVSEIHKEIIQNVFTKRINKLIKDIDRRRRDVRVRTDIIRQAIDTDNLDYRIAEISEQLLDYVKFSIEYIDNIDEQNYSFYFSFHRNIISPISDIFPEPYINVEMNNLHSTMRGQKGNLLYMLEPSFNYFKELQNTLTKSGELVTVIRKLRKKIPNFDDIRESAGSFYIFSENSIKPQPLQSMGDGFQAQLAIISAISLLKGGVSVLEEPETKLHPGYMYLISEDIVNSANHDKTQFFISTHSLEFIQSILESNTNMVNVVRLDKIENEAKMDYEIYSGEESLEMLDDLKLDLRGI